MNARQASEFGPEYFYCQYDGDVMELASEYALDRSEEITGAFVLVGDGEYLEVWLTDSSAPYLLTALYERVV